MQDDCVSFTFILQNENENSGHFLFKTIENIPLEEARWSMLKNVFPSDFEIISFIHNIIL